MKPTVRDLAMIPMMTVLVAALGQLPAIPLPMIPAPITAQTLGVMLAGIVLGAWRGAASQLLLIALVAVGAPMLAGWSGGAHRLVGPSAGFVWAWPVGAGLIGYLAERTRPLTTAKLFLYNVLGGVLVVYLIGIPFMSFVANVPMDKAIIGSAAFIPGDLVKAAVAAGLGLSIRRALARANVGPGRVYHAAD